MHATPNTVIYSTIEGHASIAAAVAECLASRRIPHQIHNSVDPVLTLYRILYRYRPSLIGTAFNIINHPQMIPLGKKILRYSYQNEASETLASFKPELCISANWGFNPSLEHFQDQQPFKFISIVCDPRSFQLHNIANFPAVNCVFDDTAAKAIRRYAPDSKLEVTGWFVRSEFEKKYDQNAVRTELGLSTDCLTYLFVSGSEGTATILKPLHSLYDSNIPLQVIVACGSNRLLKTHIQMLSKLAKNRNKVVQFIPLPFTTEIHKYMQAADLVIGKAGPNMLFESVATKTPFFASTHNSGQEDGNLDIIREYKLGYVQENSDKASELLIQIAKKPEKLAGFDSSLVELARYNEKSKTRLLKIIDQL